MKGDITGNINASDSITLRSTARVHADIYAPSLVVDKGAVFEGNSRMTNGAHDMQTITALDRRDRGNKKNKGLPADRVLVSSSGRTAQDNGNSEELTDHPVE